jgi:H/ACA ribonucleoprotein complex subunit 3
MVLLMRRCINCSEYTLKTDLCPKCGGTVKIPNPPKFSLDDRYRKYRLKMRQIARESRALKLRAQSD